MAITTGRCLSGHIAAARIGGHTIITPAAAPCNAQTLDGAPAAALPPLMRHAEEAASDEVEAMANTTPMEAAAMAEVVEAGERAASQAAPRAWFAARAPNEAAPERPRSATEAEPGSDGGGGGSESSVAHIPAAAAAPRLPSTPLPPATGAPTADRDAPPWAPAASVPAAPAAVPASTARVLVVCVGAHGAGAALASSLRGAGVPARASSATGVMDELTCGAAGPTAQVDAVLCVAALGKGGSDPHVDAEELRAVAQATRRAGVLTVGVLALPAVQDVGAFRVDEAQEAADRLLSSGGPVNEPAVHALVLLDEMRWSEGPRELARHCAALLELTETHQHVNIDFADVSHALRCGGGGRASVGQATRSGRGRAAAAARAALAACAVPETALPRAVIYKVEGPASMREVEEVGAVVSVLAHPNALIVFGADACDGQAMARQTSAASQGGGGGEPDAGGLTVTALAAGFHGIGGGFLSDSARAAALAELAVASPGVDKTARPTLHAGGETAVPAFLRLRAAEQQAQHERARHERAQQQARQQQGEQA